MIRKIFQRNSPDFTLQILQIQCIFPQKFSPLKYLIIFLESYILLFLLWVNNWLSIQERIFIGLNLLFLVLSLLDMFWFFSRICRHTKKTFTNTINSNNNGKLIKWVKTSNYPNMNLVTTFTASKTELYSPWNLCFSIFF